MEAALKHCVGKKVENIECSNCFRKDKVYLKAYKIFKKHIELKLVCFHCRNEWKRKFSK